MRCQALLIQLLHNGWRYQEQSAISQAELLANDLSAVGFYRLAHVLGQFRNTESEARVEAMNNGVLLCEQLFPCFSNKDEIVLLLRVLLQFRTAHVTVLGIFYIALVRVTSFLIK